MSGLTLSSINIMLLEGEKEETGSIMVIIVTFKVGGVAIVRISIIISIVCDWCCS